MKYELDDHKVGYYTLDAKYNIFNNFRQGALLGPLTNNTKEMFDAIASLYKRIFSLLKENILTDETKKIIIFTYALDGQINCYINGTLIDNEIEISSSRAIVNRDFTALHDMIKYVNSPFYAFLVERDNHYWELLTR